MAIVVNLQRKIKLDAAPFRVFALQILESVDEAADADFSVAFVSDRRMRELNGFFRGKDSTTDVLSFPHEPDEFENISDAATASSEGPDNSALEFLGDIVISVEQAERQAKENGLTLDGEIKQLILHGVLHLCGYDHEIDSGDMNKRELQLRKKLRI